MNVLYRNLCWTVRVVMLSWLKKTNYDQFRRLLSKIRVFLWIVWFGVLMVLCLVSWEFFNSSMFKWYNIYLEKSTEAISNAFEFVQWTGVAYSRHIVQIYSYHGGDEIRQHLEVHACTYIHNYIYIYRCALLYLFYLWTCFLDWFFSYLVCLKYHIW